MRHGCWLLPPWRQVGLGGAEGRFGPLGRAVDALAGRCLAAIARLVGAGAEGGQLLAGELYWSRELCMCQREHSGAW